MNWKRIWTGSLLAGVVIIGLDFFVNHVLLRSAWLELLRQGQIQSPKPYTVPVLLFQDWVIGLVLMWLYALARPRLGPGPKTAIVMGLVSWFLLWVPFSLNRWLWLHLPDNVIVLSLVGGLAQCWIGIYLAGWQYIEKAP